MPYQVSAARIEWGDDNVPVSSDYGDVYYSRDHGLEETRYVFLDNNQLSHRWQNLTGPLFRVAETGFGTGLNFLACWQQWQACVQDRTEAHTLQFLSVEKHPLTRTDLQRALANWPQLKAQADALIEHYPPLLRGQHRLCFKAGIHSVNLDLIFDEAEAGLRAALGTTHPTLYGQGAGVDAWFLDGFAPGTNPGMWNEPLFDLIAAHSRPGTSFATFTAAGFVKRALKERGFAVEKVRGYGRKRDMLRGEMQHTPKKMALGTKADTTAWHIATALPERPKEIAVIGAGLAGSHTARALAERGARVQVFERGRSIAPEASGNPQGILFTKLSHRDGQLNRFALTSFLHALRSYRSLSPLPGDMCGVFQLLPPEQWQQLRSTFADQDDWCRFLSREQASAISGANVASQGVLYPTAGWLEPAKVCQQLLDHPLISLHLNQPITALEREQNQWLLSGEQQRYRADAVVIASGQSASNFDCANYLPLRSIRGQLSYLRADVIEPPLKTVVCHEGYVAPAVNGNIILGASYEVDCSDTTLRTSEHQDNLRRIQAALPEAFSSIGARQVTGGRAALRCASPDYLPLVGPLAHRADTLERFAALAKNAKTPIHTTPANFPGLFVNLAHGSRGLTSTPLCAELLASQICGELAPLPADLVKALSPSRFLIRDLIRGRVGPAA